MIQTFYAEIDAVGATPITIGGDHTVPCRSSGNRPAEVGRDRADRCPCRHARNARRNQGQSRDDLPARGGGRADRPEAGYSDRAARQPFSPDDIAWGLEKGFTCVTFDAYEEMGRRAVTELIAKVVGNEPLYITIDIDGLDPAHAIGTGVPEIGGLSPRDVQVILRSLQGRDIVGADICEVAPCFDPTGITAITAANLMWELLCITADSHARRRRQG